ncbi:MAG: alcohol dehydrogenase catalytic domain-containing protein, partial [Bacteroidia bacterium]|nr:alcohol dehydrogenase catalytic domain-containing protein [Bacteroidia bacterium]
MKAAVLKDKYEPVSYSSVPDPEPMPGEVIVKVSYSALNHRDVWIQQGLYAGLKFPIILGSDGAGEIIAVGDGVSKTEIGRNVLINPSLNWGNNPLVQSRDYKILGLPDNGTFAEYIAIPLHRCYPIPEGLSLKGAAALPLAGLTAWRALMTRGQAKSNEKVLITGIG